MAPVIRGKKGEHAKIFEDARRSGYVRVRADGNLYDLSEDIPLEKNRKHHIEIVVDRLIVRPDLGQRLTDSVETASHLSGGIVIVNLLREEQDLVFSQNYACDDCGISIEELTPPDVLLQQPLRRLPHLHGAGDAAEGGPPPSSSPDDSLSILDGAITASGWNSIRSDGISRMYFEALSKKYQFSLRTPVRELPESVRQIILYGTGGEKLELHYDQPRGKGVLYQLRGGGQQSGAPVSGDSVRRQQAGDRGVHVPMPLPGLSGPPPEAGGAGGDGGWPVHLAGYGAAGG